MFTNPPSAGGGGSVYEHIYKRIPPSADVTVDAGSFSHVDWGWTTSISVATYFRFPVSSLLAAGTYRMGAFVTRVSPDYGILQLGLKPDLSGPQMAVMDVEADRYYSSSSETYHGWASGEVTLATAMVDASIYVAAATKNAASSGRRITGTTFSLERLA